MRLRRLGCEPGEKTTALYEQIKEQMQIRGRVPLLLMPDITSPALTVEPLPRLLLPDRLIFAANAESMAFAMAHELMHYKRKDYLVCLLLLLLRAAGALATAHPSRLLRPPIECPPNPSSRCSCVHAGNATANRL